MTPAERDRRERTLRNAVVAIMIENAPDGHVPPECLAAVEAVIAADSLELRKRLAREVTIGHDPGADVFIAEWPARGFHVRIPVDAVARVVAVYEAARDDSRSALN